MQITHEWQNGPEILFIEGLDLSAQYNELRVLELALLDPEQTGTATNPDGTIAKQNSGIYFHQIYTPQFAPCSPTTMMVDQILSQVKQMQFTPNSVFEAIHCANSFDVLFSAYKNGDHYKPHRDSSKLTMIAWVSGQDFDGGDLYLPDFDYTIPYRQNLAFIFPSYYVHQVTPISTDKNSFVRYCASAFIN